MNAPDRLSATARARDRRRRRRAACDERPTAACRSRCRTAEAAGVWDTEGKKYLDALGGIAVNTLGHAHPKLVPALQEQIGKLIHSSNYYHVPLQEQLAAKLCELSGLTNVFFCNSGLEANEAAIKIARKFGHDKGIERPEIVVYEKAFHGRSIATLSATGNAEGAGRLRPAGRRLRARAAERHRGAREGRAARNPNVVAVFLEIDPGRRRHQPDARRVPAAGAPHLRRARLAADARRGAVRHRPHRQVVRAPVGRHPARRDAARQGPGLGRAGRRRRLRPEGGRRVRPRQPRHHLRRQPAGDARRRRDARASWKRTGLLENAADGRRACCKAGSSASWTASPAWSRCAARA